MPKVQVYDIGIMYEAYGKSDTIVYLQSPFGGISPGNSLNRISFIGLGHES